MGEGPPLILLHGLFGMGNNLSMIARPLSEHFTVYRLDLRNHGRSPRAESMTLTEMAEDVLAFMDANHLSEASVLGHSLGGKVAMQLALLHPTRVSKLMVADIAPVAYASHHNNVFDGLNAVDLSLLTSRKDADLILQQYIDEEEVRLFILTNLYRNDRGGFDWRINLSALQQCYAEISQANDAEGVYQGPTLFIKGELSDYISEGSHTIIKRMFPQSQIKVIPATSHWLHAEQPGVFADLVKNFLLAD